MTMMTTNTIKQDEDQKEWLTEVLQEKTIFFEQTYDESWFEDLKACIDETPPQYETPFDEYTVVDYPYNQNETEFGKIYKKKLKRQNTRIKLKLRACFFIPNMKQRKDFDQNEIVILLTHMINHYNPVQFGKCELMSDEEKRMFAKYFKESISPMLKEFTKLRLYPYPDEYAFSGRKQKDKNETIKAFVYENLTVLKEYFNSNNFHKYLQQINIHATKYISCMTKKKKTCIIDLLRSKFDVDYM